MNSLDLPKSPHETRVVVAMSGGVDSSVVAGLLARQGYDVVGITLQLYDHGDATHRKGACCAGRDIHDARRVAETLGIPHYVLDYEDRFRESVIDRFADSYLAGETPIPCVECNRSVKFRDLLATARDLGADALATGHYVASHAVDGSGRRALFRALDPARDQSYFLYATTQAQLDFLRFPLGELPKDETRRLARDLGLTVAEKPDSQDICFVPQGRYADVIARLRPDAARAGEIVHLDGRTLGRHQGVLNFTVGQRRGLKLSTGEPLYVVRLEPEAARVVVGPREALATQRIRVDGLNWLGAEPAGAVADRPVAVRVRSTREPRPARLTCDAAGEGAEIVLEEAEDGVSPGQACVIYADAGPRAQVLGGGTIRRIDTSQDRPAHAA
ncbi:MULTISPECIES: tRNA 2-thiouridine(34) synthase MnmA [Methylobacterium]|uniref:tRNA-specific 2-thiouridylase MnmA n=2 Tax=Pseudomonadota TaxID=1224 RepID=A0ABQ4SU62_9HYPH|nr:MULTISPECIES: tRNA 2-thiouridine(34) synthase MnmA [Methylobacterium]PIU04204.1 MAG: tRNA 2-thiouridine(34) synthase MnmA [Methylobacterium sp. CG09_land_8_20_14_0_10_71_15]PIU13757.1 MAG: tRNA 2-thiouridine(34) synthase MnmA [Methylobacterium sp. CG08_land_8_20_14_0_20_71_15]GBU17092.1 tRNA(Gln,Lys,Glu) U34 2-thiouridylase [Methylobacterium sp.]GJE06637.1 tRNA-specific 2-thiouridylase MnmA [Methylobacterium jeotgali]